jgi:pyruvate carboxylase
MAEGRGDVLEGDARATEPLRAGAPQVPGTPDPVKDSSEVVEFAKKHGLPVAIKAAFGGGGRGMKVARNLEEIPELFDSAVREAIAAHAAAGKGLVLLHPGLWYNWANWTAYNRELAGGGSRGHDGPAAYPLP